jgi:hypothetical protein
MVSATASSVFDVFMGAYSNAGLRQGAGHHFGSDQPAACSSSLRVKAKSVIASSTSRRVSRTCRGGEQHLDQADFAGAIGGGGQALVFFQALQYRLIQPLRPVTQAVELLPQGQDARAGVTTSRLFLDLGLRQFRRCLADTGCVTTEERQGDGNAQSNNFFTSIAGAFTSGIQAERDVGIGGGAFQPSRLRAACSR